MAAMPSMSQLPPSETIPEHLCIRSTDFGRRSSLASYTKTSTLDNCSLTRFVETWQRIKDRRSLDFSWRDSVEYQIIKFDHEQRQAILCPDQASVLRKVEKANGKMWQWQPGFAKFAIEAATSRPYSPQLEDLLNIQKNFMWRRRYLRSFLNHDHIPFTLNILPDLDFGKHADLSTLPVSNEQSIEPAPLIRRSVSMHVRCPSVGNIPSAYKSEPTSPTSKYSYPVRPRLRSIATESALLLKQPTEAFIPEAGARGLRVTFGCHDLREARFLHDQLCVLSPIMLAFTASTPVCRGRLSEYDVRLRSFSKSPTDPRIDAKCALARPWRLLYPTYLGLDAPRSRLTRTATNKEVFHFLRSHGIDDALALYCGQGYTICCPTPAENELITKKPEVDCPSTLFQQITSSLNPYVQLKLPQPSDLKIGFRIEFGAMEIQLTDFANAACIFFIALLRFAILGFDLDFRLPPHMVAENTAKAHRKDSILVEKFWWRSVRWGVSGFGLASDGQPLTTDSEPTLVSIDHIINGDPARPETVGLSGVLDSYLADVEDASDSGSHNGTAPPLHSEQDGAAISRYLAFIRRRAKGTVWTEARLIRHFVRHHPEHVEDEEEEGGSPEVLSPGIWYDLVQRIDELNDGMVRGSGNGKGNGKVKGGS